MELFHPDIYKTNCFLWGENHFVFCSHHSSYVIPPYFLPVLILPHLSKDPSRKWLTTRPWMPHLDLCQAPGAFGYRYLRISTRKILWRGEQVFKNTWISKKNLFITVINHKPLFSKKPSPKKNYVFNILLLFFSNVAGYFLLHHSLHFETIPGYLLYPDTVHDLIPIGMILLPKFYGTKHLSASQKKSRVCWIDQYVKSLQQRL